MIGEGEVGLGGASNKYHLLCDPSLDNYVVVRVKEENKRKGGRWIWFSKICPETTC